MLSPLFFFFFFFFFKSCCVAHIIQYSLLDTAFNESFPYYDPPRGWQLFPCPSEADVLAILLLLEVGGAKGGLAISPCGPGCLGS